MAKIDIAIIILYHIAIFGVGFLAKSKIKTVDDYLVADNRFSVFSLTCTITASLIGAGMTMGVVGKVTQYGSGILWNFYGFAIGLVLFAFAFVPGIRKSRKRSMAELIGGDYGRLPRFISGIFIAVYAFAIMVIGVTGMARLITYIFGNPDLIIPATLFSSFVAIVLTALGGLYSVVWTDTAQFVIMVVIIAVLAPFLAVKKVGFEAINTALASVGGTLSKPAQNVPTAYIVYSLLTLLIAVPGDPTVPQRALAGKNSKTVKYAFLLSAVFAVLFGYALTVVGGGIMVLMPDIADVYGTSEAVLPVFMIEYFPPVLAGLGISALFATIITTITSMLLVGTTHLVYDAGQSLFPRIPDEKFKRIIPVSTVVLGLTVTWLSLKVESIGTVVYFAFSLCGAFVFPMFAALYWKRVSSLGLSLGVLVGSVLIIGMYLMGISGPGGDPVYLGLAMSVVFTVIPSLFSKSTGLGGTQAK